MRKFIFCFTLSVTLLNPFVSKTPAQSSPETEALSKDIEPPKSNQLKLQRDFEELNKFLANKNTRSATLTTDVILSISGNPFKGQTDAPLTLVEFSDSMPFLRAPCPSDVSEHLQGIYSHRKA